eukprot:TRINITY_DN120_c0_g1::TRINITY_DN120_c0_g1_i1::g.14431::m.14431 TRINITY_DN120_c0_g1::TRINITY_DN120_c0_g1_i1::g.14431  ORF type:complete len:454 (+),score=20.43,sp/Q9FPT1/UBP12_ARATH/29.69/2e-15,zf-C3HC4_3/PF13920.1/1.7e+03,zf-C3HC4_3/PF13920.1/1.5e-10,MATH/PF00917.21/9.4e-10,zf-C3HC4_2/PF13923.1/3.6e+02,zf-C3HC4_2/PF13923.1/5.2e-06,zf-RING_2/PF13639.1/1.5e+03,zf-RING_2/PF13639.1/0.00012,zf-RING_5/PF14634.1/1.6e+02,zf-RING_5/PF14634.1/0.008,Cut12/PF11500.3/0.12,Baculo_IE-1/PF05290.6/1.9e+03,Baculo_
MEKVIQRPGSVRNLTSIFEKSSQDTDSLHVRMNEQAGERAREFVRGSPRVDVPSRVSRTTNATGVIEPCGPSNNRSPITPDTTVSDSASRALGSVDTDLVQPVQPQCKLTLDGEYVGEYIFAFQVDNGDNMGSERVVSDVFCIGHFNWRLTVYPRGNPADPGSGLGVFLEAADTDHLQPTWTKPAVFSLALISQTRPELQPVRRCEKTFDSRNVQWGFKSLVSLQEFRDHKKSYIVDGKAVIKACVKVYGTVAEMGLARTPSLSKRHSMPALPYGTRSASSSRSVPEDDSLGATHPTTITTRTADHSNCQSCVQLRDKVQMLEATVDNLETQLAVMAFNLQEEHRWNVLLNEAVARYKSEAKKLSKHKNTFEQLLEVKLREQQSRFLEEKERIQRENECKICYDSQIEEIVLPCGHVCICSSCAAVLSSSIHAQTLCPICRTPCQSIRKAYLS